MKKVDSDIEIIKSVTDPKAKVILDIGCGSGDLVRYLTQSGAIVTGIDMQEMIFKAEKFQKEGNEIYKVGGGESIPMPDSKTDIIIFDASFHHIPLDKMNKALDECNRVLKKGGLIIIIEPVPKKGSYHEIIKLVEDEFEIQQYAYKVIKNSNFTQLDERLFYLERSIKDYIKLLNIFVEFDQEREIYIDEAKEITRELAKKQNTTLDGFRYKSIARLNVLRKDG